MIEQPYHIDTLKAYLAGKLDGKMMHAIEKRALEDPFLAEALEGLMQQPAESVTGLDELSERLKLGIVQDKSDENSKSNSDIAGNSTDEPSGSGGSKTGKRTVLLRWMGAAAVLLIGIAAWTVYQMQQAATTKDRIAGNITTEVTRSLIEDSIKRKADLLVTDSAGHSASGTGLAGLNGATKKADDARSLANARRNDLPVGKQADEAQDNIAKTSAKPEVAGQPITRPDNRVAMQRKYAPLTPAESKAAPISDIQGLHQAGTARLNNTQLNQKAIPAEAENDAVQQSAYMASGRQAKIRQSKEKIDVGIKPRLSSSAPGLERNLIRIPGLKTTDTDSATEKLARISIRGRGTLDSSKMPLYILDGRAVNAAALDSLNPDHIASLSVIKNPSAVALYGGRAANGAVLITMKSVRQSPASDISSVLSGRLAGVSLEKNKGKSRVVSGRKIAGNIHPVGDWLRFDTYVHRRLKGLIKPGLLSDTGMVRVKFALKDNGGKRSKPAAIEIMEASSDKLKTIVISLLENGPDWKADEDSEAPYICIYLFRFKGAPQRAPN
ncbi:MAG TPA: TonB-dependent receptor plug domain-containing protein [Arachidicoccus sp.]|nr:TonB-dependent receptor plug domain-containing protein [Arachidicoccus sp.]